MQPSTSAPSAWQVGVRGTVQGVGFRPWVARLARELALTGSVRNEGGSVAIVLVATSAELEGFLARLRGEAPGGAALREVELAGTRAATEDERAGFAILPSAPGGGAAQLPAVQADAAPCAACWRELRDPRARRFRYPFTACAECGPRYSVLRTLPYDRAGTAWAEFPPCADCQAEYDDPRDRRHHAQGVSCPACGPALWAWSATGGVEARAEEALARAALALQAGGLVALKGVGGWQLVCAADDPEAVARLRQLKGRPHKPLAVLVADLAAAEAGLVLGPAERAALAAPAAPIVLAPRARAAPELEGVAPGLDLLGVMLPASPLHALLSAAVGRWLVVTSANREGEPILREDERARAELGGSVELLLGHEREVVRRVDDSLVRVLGGRPSLLRRARGYVAGAWQLPEPWPAAVAVGGHLKTAPAAARGREVLLAPHVGDLEGPAARAWHAAEVEQLLAATPRARLACDLHPDYASTRLAEGLARPLLRVQHHEAHALAAWVEGGAPPRALAICWDGGGYGPDGTIWGGEAFWLERPGLRRCARLRPFLLPGGEAAVREPRRAALGLLLAAGRGEEQVPGWEPAQRELVERAAARGLNAPRTSSVGRLFDAVAGLTGLLPRASYEGQAALALERAACGARARPYSLVWRAPSDALAPWELDWAPLLDELLRDRAVGLSAGAIAGRFHAGLAAAIAALAEVFAAEQVLLGGGCFQNALLIEQTAELLGPRVRWPSALPPNDGGLALGQLAAVAWAVERGACV